MKKLFAVLLFVLLLAGCGDKPTYEIIGDIPAPEDTPQMLDIIVQIPEEAASSVMTGDDGAKLYLCQDYFITLQTLPAGDMDLVFRELTGYGAEDLQVIQSQFQDLDRYRIVWTAAAEGGDQVGRACVYSDGNYCYALTAMAAEDKAASLISGAWKELFDSFMAVEAGSVIDSGS